MAGEHQFINDVIEDLDAALAAAGVTSRNYGLIGFGSSGARIYGGYVGGVTSLTTAAAVKAATSSLETSGGTEDGYQALDFALNNYNLTSQARNFILISDEDRDNMKASLTASSMASALSANNAILNAVVDNSLYDGANNAAIGVTSKGEAYIADGSGGFQKAAGGVIGHGMGTTTQDYANLATASGGAVWDLKLLRAGGLTATSFTNAFIDGKVREIEGQIPTVPVPAPALMLVSGLFGLSLIKRKRASA